MLKFSRVAIALNRLALGLIILAGVGGATLGATAAGASMSAFDFSFVGIDGAPLPLAKYRGHPIMVVNTASQCGFTPQYAGLKKLYDRFKDRGFVIIGVPSNDFGAQEPGNSAEIKQFCESRFDIDFPLAEKVAVTGAGAHPFYRWAVATLGDNAKPRWNFHKYIVAPDGTLAGWFPTATEPTDASVVAALTPFLAPAKN